MIRTILDWWFEPLEWAPLVILRSKRATDGSTLPGCTVAMRRKVNGEWQYRRPTRAEESGFVADDAW